MLTRACIVLLLVVPLCGCSWFRDQPECVGDGCQLLEQKAATKTWYCTGSEQGETWKCREKTVPGPTTRPDSRS